MLLVTQMVMTQQERDLADCVSMLKQQLGLTQVQAENVIKIATMLNIMERSIQNELLVVTEIKATQEILVDTIKDLMSSGSDGLGRKLANILEDSQKETIIEVVKPLFNRFYYKMVGTLIALIAVMQFLIKVIEDAIG